MCSLLSVHIDVSVRQLGVKRGLMNAKLNVEEMNEVVECDQRGRLTKSIKIRMRKEMK